MPLLLLLWASACAGPRPPVPQGATIVPPAAWREPHAGGPPIDPSWWRNFQDSRLDALVGRALEDDDDIAIAAQRVEEARAQLALARSQQLPAIDAAASPGTQRSVSAFGAGADQSLVQGQVSLSYDADLFGRLRAGSAAARAQLLATGAARDGVRLAVQGQIVTGYVSLVVLDARLAVLRQTLAARSDALRIARRRSEAGYAPRLDLAQAEADYRSTEQLIPPARSAIAAQESALSIMLSQPPGPVDRTAALDQLKIPPVAPSLPGELLRRRPDVVEAEQTLVAADHRLDASRAALLPTFRISASGGVVASSLLATPVTLFSLGGSVLAPLFQGGRLRAQRDVDAARRDQAAYAYRKAVLGALRDVENGLARARDLTDQEAALELQVEAQQVSLQLATKRYRSGYSPFLEQLDAQRSLLAGQLALVQVRGDRLNAAVALYQSLGGGWRAEEAELRREPK
ncbi:efflux transporter outer membrane subunit [Sphingomonas sp. BK069]|uniref:efflux transporter outer membrane subunit n=1 Tax=Sphingomonas sp. BK069 TaxID=2586979 RepID=UPI0017AA59A0|nr:efflux transporter outer membrane subunit [Sphingomonas sp. BK069]MBB3348336.1 NodT family efflux transporter outer membrane factor (OMF) lipoprotein [Sphingomonas sp. BK069]